MKNWQKTVLIIVFILFTLGLITVSVFLSTKKKVGETRTSAAVEKASIFLWPNAGTLKTGKKIPLEIKITVQNQKPDSLDFIIVFDPKVFLVEEKIIPGSTFSSYPASEVNNQKGTITLAARGPFKNNNTVATINLIPKQSGSSKISFSYINLPGLDYQTQDANFTITD